MLKSILIGHLGADAEVQNVNGKEFVSFRIANTDKWTTEAGEVHENITWVDCILNGKPKVFEFLKKGQLVFVDGRVTLRVYSSVKDKCMKAGMTIGVMNIELLGGKSDDVPSRLYTEDGSEEVAVGKFYYSPLDASKLGKKKIRLLRSKSGKLFAQDPEGFIKPAEAAGVK